MFEVVLPSGSVVGVAFGSEIDEAIESLFDALDGLGITEVAVRTEQHGTFTYREVI